MSSSLLTDMGYCTQAMGWLTVVLKWSIQDLPGQKNQTIAVKKRLFRRMQFLIY